MQDPSDLGIHLSQHNKHFQKQRGHYCCALFYCTQTLWENSVRFYVTLSGN